MNPGTRFRRAVGKMLRTIYPILPLGGIRNPIFVIGCGRSGTTILGTTLSRHGLVTYLNEPRHLWFQAYPEADIWTGLAASRNGRLGLTDADADDRKSRKLKRLFRLETLLSKKPVLIEKLPINSFRLKLIHTVFPDARYIHIHRNGLEVARSIQKASEAGSWFGANSYKWDRLAEYASTRIDGPDIASLCTDYREMGLLEWRLSTEAVVDFLGDLPPDAYVELSYDELMRHPVETVSRILKFIGIDPEREVTDFASETIRRRTSALVSESMSEKDVLIGGRLLLRSIDGRGGLTEAGS